MASPFRVFRKYQKTLLVVAGVILMFVFVIGDALVGYLGGSRSASGPPGQNASDVAVSWDDGELTNAELDNLVFRRQVTNAFLANVEAFGEQSARLAGVEPRALRVQRLTGPGTREQGVEQSVVHTKFFSDAAREVGLRVSDAMVVQYLDDLGRGNVSRDDMRQIVDQMQKSGWRVSIDYVIDAVREELLVRNYLMSHWYAFQTVTPQQRWADWLSVNDRVVVEAAAIPVESFVAKVPEPTEAELAAFFEKYKNNERGPERIGDMELPSATPGFRVPRKIDVQFVRADFDEYLTKVESEITDEEIAKYYEENKEQFITADTQFFEDEGQPDDTPSDQDGTSNENATEEAGTSESAPATEGAVEGAPASEPETTEPAAPPAAGAGAGEPASDAAAENSASEDSNGGEQPSGSNESPAAPDGEAPAEEGETTSPAETDQSLRGGASGRGTISLAAFLQEERAAEEDATPMDESAAPAESSAEPPVDSEADEPAPGEPASTGEPAAPPATTSEGEPPAESVPAATPPAAAPAAEKPKEYQPLEEVSDVIRRMLARQRVVDQMTQLMDELMVELSADFQKYLAAVLDAGDEGPQLQPPASLADLKPLAEKHGLGYEKTGPMPWIDFRHTPLGKSGIPGSRDNFADTLFTSREIDLYEPVLTVDIDNNHYIAMKTSDSPARVPKLAQVYDEVVRAYKLQKAAELALKDAEEQAKKVEQAGSTLADLFADRPSVEVVRTDPFSHLTLGDVASPLEQPRFRYSQPDGIVAPGPAFLREVFELEDGKVGAVLNHDHSIAYVVRVVEHQDSREELRRAFLAEAQTWPGARMMNAQHAQMAQQRLAREIGAGLDWKRPHDQVDRDGEE